MEVKLPNNSDKALAEVPEKRVQNKVISGKVKHHTTMGKLLRQTFIPEDVSNARDYILADLVMPAIKNGIFDTVLNIIDYWRGGSGNYRRPNTSATSRFSNSGQTQYNRFAPRISQGPVEPVYGGGRYSYDDIVIEDYGPSEGGSARAKADAEGVLVCMQNTIDQYSVVRVSDLFEFVGLTGAPTDYNYGWTNIANAYTKRVSGGWLIVLPKAMAIDNN